MYDDDDQDDYVDDGWTSFRHSRSQSIYYAGFEVGSGISGLTIFPTNNRTLLPDLVTLPSFIADGDLSMLFKGCDPDAKHWEMLWRDDCVLTWQDHTYFLGDLVAHGTHLDNAFNDQSRYWSEHAQILLLCLAGMLIPEPCFELRLVTALPVSLCDGERREPFVAPFPSSTISA